MIVFLNGQFVLEEQALISVFDRSFLYGDGLFETMRVVNGKPFRWAAHVERLRGGAEFLNIQLPYKAAMLHESAEQLIVRNKLPESLLRLTISRGVGPRGYSPKGAEQPSVVMSLYPAPSLQSEMMPRWRLATASVRLPANEPLAQFKTCNKLAQILAKSQAEEAGAEEALLLNTDGCVVEGASSNLFWIEDQTICTPRGGRGRLAGVSRAV
jgi:branched-chain amino acid aminotransferase